MNFIWEEKFLDFVQQVIDLILTEKNVFVYLESRG